MLSSSTPSIEHIRQLFMTAGTHLYGGEAVSQKEHALQAAWFAEKEGESDALIVACLLHDLGHILFDENEEYLNKNMDDMHQSRVVPYLSALFPAEVTAPIGMHVDAKRYLCFAEAGYHASLSEASKNSLELQGGVMSADEAEQFIQSAFAHDAVALRRCDDAAKIAGLVTPDFEYFLPHLLAVSMREAG
jgi:phosphonate degradation associated HDIG domain protein